MFPNGVIYDGVEDNKPLYFRGESGANDSIVRFQYHGKIQNRVLTDTDSAPGPPPANSHASDSAHGDPS